MNLGGEYGSYETLFYNRLLNLKEKAVQNEDGIVYQYIKSLEEKLSILIADMSEKNFWIILPKILGIDARVSLLEDLLHVSPDFCLSGGELIKLVESDYKKFNQENYELDSELSRPIFFYVD
ncbi:hypothetical protein OZZ98_12030 [Enterococcus sp. E5-79]|uniref:DUF7006 family protein n=1 Tax=Enterococcus TaxID=1350 RepID=UPI000CF5E3D3|nr:MULTISPECIES: hypothetical protein [Enterococcus]MEB4744268.1 hypothetical protein [Enterococcus sp. E5-79]PQB99102.1 hypothetical protein CUN14_12975 [Enterococcus faecium]